MYKVQVCRFRGFWIGPFLLREGSRLEDFGVIIMVGGL